MSEPLLTRKRIVAALQALGDELTKRGVHGQIFIVGGAAMALAYSTRRITRDVDAVFEPKSAIYDAATIVALQFSLPDDWLNDGVKGFLPGPDSHAISHPEIEGLEVTSASPRFLLAMKLLALRIGEDDDDILFLLRLCGITTVEEALSVLTDAYPERPVLPKARFFLEELLGTNDSMGEQSESGLE